MKNQALFSSKDKSKKIKCLLQFLFGALRVKGKNPLTLNIYQVYLQCKMLHSTEFLYDHWSHIC